jgi:AraC-like DNA-binding protein
MTRHANSLTKGATRSGRRESPSWTLPASDLRATISGLGSLGYDAGVLLAAVGLSDADMTDPDVRVPCETFGQIVARAQQERFTPNLALELARVTPMGAYPLLDYLVLTSDSIGAGVRQLACYLRLVGNPVVLTADDSVNPVRVETAGTALPFSVEYSVSLMVLHFRDETDGRFAPASVAFQHAPDDVGGFARAFGCPVLARSSWSGMNVAPDAWRMPLRRRDPVLRQVLETQANAMLAKMPARTGLALEVQRALSACIIGGDTRIATLARGLAMSDRTLQRRLTAEGVSYQELLDEVRKETAGRHISEPRLAIGEVAYLLGYSEPAPFHRAFKRWYGITPDVFRRTQRSSAAGSMNARTERAVNRSS